jgi:hypothetical protein
MVATMCLIIWAQVPAFAGWSCEEGGSSLAQNERILRHLRDYGSISSMEAVQDYGIMRLASRISDLKKAGIPIRREMVTGKNRYGETASYARYSLIQER